MRVSVVDWNDKVIYASPVNQDASKLVRADTRPAPTSRARASHSPYIRARASHSPYIIDYTGGNDGDLAYLKDLLKKNMQLNLLDATVDEETSRVVPKLVIVCPDYLIDISSLAACFREYGHHPLNYFLNKIKTKPMTWQILLGNLAGHFLDDYVNETSAEPVNYSKALNKFFKSSALDFCTCRLPDDFHTRSKAQMENIRDTVQRQLPAMIKGYDRANTLLEPSFICEKLGLQGRADMLQSDFTVLIEQKSGKRDERRNRHKEDHFVQMMLYHGVLKQNFVDEASHLQSFLFYSKYADGLMAEHFDESLFRETIKLRNMIVAQELAFSEGGIKDVLETISPDMLNVNHLGNKLWTLYQEPELRSTIETLKRCPPVAKAYFERFFTFVSKELVLSKTGGSNDPSRGFAGTWHLTLQEKLESGNIIIGAVCSDIYKSDTSRSYDMLRFRLTMQDETYQPNFRKGDIVIIYSYCDSPDARTRILMKGSIAELTADTVVIRLRIGMQNVGAGRIPARNETFAIEHDSSDITSTVSFKGLFRLLSANPDRQDILLCQRNPQQDETITLNGSYGQFDNLVLKMKRNKDYFLLSGPPGTGKTSCALRYMVEETLTETGTSILLMSYTNRAVDEICDMLVSSGIASRHRFIRIGNELSCDKRFSPYLLSNCLDDCPKLSDIKRLIAETRIFVATTTAVAGKVNLFSIKRFDVAFIDESSQILEPDIVGLLSAKTGDKNALGKFVMIGDYKQLPAIAQQTAASAKVNDHLLNKIGLTDCRNSLFERLYKQSPDYAKDVLRTQGRMHPDVSAYPCEAFYSAECLKPAGLPHQTEPFPYQESDGSLLTTRRLIFIPIEDSDDNTSSDKVNRQEAIAVASLISRIYSLTKAGFDANKTVGVIVPYRNQITMIRNEISKLGIPDLNNISIDTVERYQGSQRDVIIYSFTISNASQLDFLTANTFIENGKPIDRKLNVAMTRARKQILLVGNPQVLSANPLFRHLIEYIRKQGGLLN